MQWNRRGWLGGAAGAALAVATGAAWSQDKFPSRPVKILIPSAPGGPADIILRTLNPKMIELLGQPVVLENRTGASGTIGLNAVARSAPDGYQLVLVSETHTAAETLYPKRGYTMTQDLAPVATLVNMPSVVVVHKDLPVKSIQDLLALARQKPGKLSFASGGNGNTNHMGGELLQQQAGVKFLHVPYSQAANGRTDLLSGQIDMMIDSLASMQPHIASGAVRALAVTSTQRLAALPNVPTVAESGVPGYAMEIWFGLMGPAGMPAPVVQRLNEVVGASLQDKTVMATLAAGALTPITATPDKFRDMIKVSIDKWAAVLKAGNVKIE